MSYGIQVRGPAGNETINLSMSGGRSYVQEIRRTWSMPGGQRFTYTFPNIPSGDDLVVYVVQLGPFYWEASTVNNQAVITLIANVPFSGTIGSFYEEIVLLVFTRKTVETFNSDYGVAFINEAGERTVSAIYPTAEFIGKLTFSAVPDTSEYGSGHRQLPRSSYYMHTHSSTPTNIGAGRKRIILWNLPSTGEEQWYTCSTSYMPDTVTGNFQVAAQVVSYRGKGYALPEAYVFAVDGINPSSDSYGLRIYDASGRVTFDAGLNHMVIKSLYDGMDFNIDEIIGRSDYQERFPQFFLPDVLGPANTYTITGFDGIVPLIFLPTMFVEEGIPIRSQYIIQAYYTYYHTGMTRKAGNTLSLRAITTGFTQEDRGLSSNFWWEAGSIYNNGTVIVDATPLGGAAVIPIDLQVTSNYINITQYSTLNVTWTSSGAASLSWYLDGVYQGELPLNGSAEIGPFPLKPYTSIEYIATVVAKNGAGQPITSSTIEWFVYP
jgi:hypothetical protein